MSPHSLAGRPVEVCLSVTSISRAVVPVLKIAPPVAFRQSIFFCVLASIYLWSTKIATRQRHKFGSWKGLFTQHFCFCISSVTCFSTPFLWGINSMQCYWKKEEGDQYKTESPYHLYTRIFGVEISIAKGCHWVVLFTIDGFMWKLQSNVKSPFSLTQTKQNKQAKQTNKQKQPTTRKPQTNLTTQLQRSFSLHTLWKALEYKHFVENCIS